MAPVEAGPITIEEATQGPILDQMLELERNVDNIPEDASITVRTPRTRFSRSSSAATRTSDSRSPTPMCSSPMVGRRSASRVLTRCWRLMTSTRARHPRRVSECGRVQGRISSDLQQLLDLQITLNVSDMDTEQVTLNVAELSGLGVKFVEAHHSVAWSTQ